MHAMGQGIHTFRYQDPFDIIRLMNDETHFVNHYSTLTALILLIYVLATFVTSRIISIPIQIGSFSLTLNWKMIDMIAPAAGLLAGIGTYNFVSLRTGKPIRAKILQTIIPFATTFALGIVLRNTGISIGWAVILFFGGILLYLVFMSEGILCNPGDPRIAFVTILLTSLAYATFLVTVIGVRVNISRLAVEIPIILLSSFILSMRIFSLHEHIKDIELKAGVVSLVVTEIAAALHYWPIHALSYGVLFFLFFYILTNIVIILPGKATLRSALISQSWVFVLLIALFIYFEVSS